MSKEYQYLDPDYVYTDPDTGVLRNLAGIDDQRSLMFAESAAVSKRSGELRTNPIRIDSSRALFTIHHHLFQDIYSWAGMQRTVEISKGGRPFFLLAHFSNAFNFIDNLIWEYHRLESDDKLSLSRKLAEILDAINFLHPFRDGNGRTQREFLRLLAAEKGWNLNLNPPDNPDTYVRYMNGTINGDVASLTDLIYETMSK